MNLNNHSNKHMNYIKNIMKSYSESNLNIENFCNETGIKEINFKRYLNDFYTLAFEDPLKNSYYIYDVKENF